MITEPELSPRIYENSTEDNPQRFGVNAFHHAKGYGRPGWETICDGVPTPMGCANYIEHTRPYTKFGRKRKASGWLLTYGKNDDGTDDRRIVLAFCPRCADVVEEQEASRDPR